MNPIQPCFIFGAFRSGTTAFCKILNLNEEVEILIEDEPKLCFESREFYDNPNLEIEPLLNSKIKNIGSLFDKNNSFIDKNPNYLTFLPFLVKKYDCKVIFLYRDGRDVVRSLMDWHDLQGKSIFTLQEDFENSKRSDYKDFPWDYSLQRPKKDSILFDKWKSMERFEKCSWYWNEYNTIALDVIEEIKADCGFKSYNMNLFNSNDVQDAYNFLNLKNYNKKNVDSYLKKRINSVKDRSGVQDSFPNWNFWSQEYKIRFYKYASPMMNKLGYLK